MNRRVLTIAPEHIRIGDTIALRGIVGEVSAVEQVADLVTVWIFTEHTRETISDTFSNPAPGHRRVLVERYT